MESLKKRLERVKISVDSHIKDDFKERKKIHGISSYRKKRMRAAEVKAVPSNPRRLKMKGGIKSMLSGLKKQMPAAEMQGMLCGSQKLEMPSEEFQGLPSDAGKEMPSANVQGLPSDAGKEMPSANVQGLPSDAGKEMPSANVQGLPSDAGKEMPSANVQGLPSDAGKEMPSANVQGLPSDAGKEMPSANVQGLPSDAGKEMPSANVQGLPSDAGKEMPSANVQGLPSDAGKEMPSANVQGLPSDAGKEMPSARVDANCNIVFKENFHTLFIEKEYLINKDVKKCMEELNTVHKRLLCLLMDFKQDLHKKCEELLRHEDTCDVRRAQKVEARNCAFEAIKMIHTAARGVSDGYMKIKVHTNSVVNLYDRITIKNEDVDIDLLIECLPVLLRHGNERLFIEEALDITNCMVNQLNRRFKPIYVKIQDLECLLNQYFYQTRVVLY
ncbi:hypothetical protein CDAR_554941 [Caerostris darwini]|uniref:Uncharacterized protein n=1 Tax=Caerostris darwini TaxID=1538125 RepID=A0AAV4RGK2_9ARAC|nr:hypothetical protein CDAR_554941 [Caerostris darwini]